jgi:predicted transcriptional regulator
VDDFVLGDRELDVMGVLWDLGSGTVAEVRDKLPADLAYTTVLTILRNLEAKEFVYHEAEGKAHRYFPQVAQRTARRSAVARIVDKLFHGSPQQLVTQLVEDEALSARDLKRLRALLAAQARPTVRKGGEGAAGDEGGRGGGGGRRGKR